MSGELGLFDPTSTGMVANGEMVFINFDGGQVAVVLVAGEPMPILNLACRDLRLDWKSQYAKIKADPAICMVENTTQLPGDDQSRVVMTTDLDGFGLWLAKINANRVSPEARDLVITWQRKAARAIRERFFGRSVVQLPDRRALAVMVIEAEDRAVAERQRADALQTTVKALEPAALAWATFRESGATLSVGAAAKYLAQRHGLQTGRNRLYDTLRELGWCFQRSTEPAGKAVSAGLVEVDAGSTYVVEATGEKRNAGAKTRLTARGMEHLAEHFGFVLDLDQLAGAIAAEQSEGQAGAA